MLGLIDPAPLVVGGEVVDDAWLACSACCSLSICDRIDVKMMVMMCGDGGLCGGGVVMSDT